ncbi:unannotated protein [freshwater metagenome]|uniref:Unannotated protein n=1 Tax=freshwater metagenome TaxID=449393 RepID=A0A6J6EKM8_9ZZZZ
MTGDDRNRCVRSLDASVHARDSVEEVRRIQLIA